MQELIKVTTNEQGFEVVSGRELHKFLATRTRFDKWMVRMLEYGFEEKKDYLVMPIFGHNSKGGKQQATDYALTIDTAKEIAMLQRSEKGKQARQYFIECERIAKQRQQAKPMTQLEMMAQMIQVSIEQEKALKALQQDQKEIKEKLHEIECRTTTSPESYTIVGYSKSIGKYITLSQSKVLGKRAKNICIEKGYELEKIIDARYGKIGVYPKDVLKEAFNGYFN